MGEELQLFIDDLMLMVVMGQDEEFNAKYREAQQLAWVMAIT